MRLTKFILVLVFLAVAAVYTIQGAAGRDAAAEVPPVISCDTGILELSVHDGGKALLTGVTASDAHSASHRTPHMEQLNQWLEDHLDADYVRILTEENPRRLIRGETMVPVE